MSIQQLWPSIYLYLHLLRLLVADMDFALEGAVLLLQRVDALAHLGREQTIPLLLCNQLLGWGVIGKGKRVIQLLLSEG